MDGRVMERITEDRPQELRLRVRALAQRRETLHGVLRLEDLHDSVVGRAFGRAVGTRAQVEDLDLAGYLLIDAGLRLLAEGPFVDQHLDPCRDLEVRMPG